MKRFILFFGIIIVAACFPEKAPDTAKITFAKETIRILRQDRPAVVLTVEIADTNAKRERGLMYRTDLKDDEGMLFLFPVGKKVGMWMANTPTSLDMLFVDEHGKITEIVENTVPFSHDEIRSAQSVKGVLELKGGIAKRAGIEKGDIVVHSFFDLEKALGNM